MLYSPLSESEADVTIEPVENGFIVYEGNNDRHIATNSSDALLIAAAALERRTAAYKDKKVAKAAEKVFAFDGPPTPDKIFSLLSQVSGVPVDTIRQAVKKSIEKAVDPLGIGDLPGADADETEKI